LSSFDLLWQLNLPADDTTWALLLNQLAALILDDRFDVAHAAVKTFFSMLSSNVNEIPRSITSHYLTDGWPALLRNEALLSFHAVLVVVLQEIAHHVCVFWDQFDLESLRTQFVPLSIDVTENLLRTCTAKEIIIDTYQIYGYFLTIPNPTVETQLAWAESLQRILHEKFKPMRDFNSSILSHLGRFMCNAVKSFAGRLDSVPYSAWLKLVVDIALSFETGEFVHITPQRALDGFVFLFPLPEPYVGRTLAAFVEIFTRTDKEALRRNLCDDLLDIWEKKANRRELILAAKPLCAMGAAAKLCAAFVAAVPAFEETEKQAGAECYREIARGHPTLASQAESCAQSIC
jgi:hypothetical protein